MMTKAVTASTPRNMAVVLTMSRAVVALMTGTLHGGVAVIALRIRAGREHEKRCKCNRQPSKHCAPRTPRPCSSQSSELSIRIVEAETCSVMRVLRAVPKPRRDAGVDRSE